VIQTCRQNQSGLSLVPRAETDRASWDSLLIRCPAASIFHTWDWQELLAEVYGVSIGRSSVLLDGETIGCFPYCVTSRGGLRVIASPLMGWATPYLGPVLTVPGVDVSPLVCEMIRAEGCEYSELTVFDPEAVGRLASHGYRISARTTLLTDLAVGEEALWKGISKSTRRQIRKAEKEGVIAEDARWEDVADRYWEMAVETYRKSRRRPPIPKKMFQLLSERFAPAQRTKVLVARRGDEILAAKVILLYGNRMHWWDGVSGRRFSSFSPHGLLNWQSLRWGSKNGFAVCDFGGANDPHIARFKSSFGGRAHEFVYGYRNHSLRASLVRPLYRPLARVWREVQWRFRSSSEEQSSS
jgi:CelD/BcsL family acetyltransferase involved in cellulose biosynthesis